MEEERYVEVGSLTLLLEVQQLRDEVAQGVALGLLSNEVKACPEPLVGHTHHGEGDYLLSIVADAF